MPASQQRKKKLIVLAFLITGVIGTYASKLQGSQLVQQGKYENKKFFHPYMQSMVMFIGQSLCLLVYYGQYNKNKIPLEPQKTKHSKLVFLIPALADSVATTMQYMGLFFVSGSTYLMLKGASIVTIVIFSQILLKMVIKRRHIAGCGLAILGLVFVGVSGFFSESESDHQQQGIGQQILGYILILTSLIFSGFFFAYQQKLLSKHTIHPLQMVGFEGCYGLILMNILACIFAFVPCNFGKDGCVFDDDNSGFIQLPLVYIKQVFSDYILIILVISSIISLAGYNFSGVSITKSFDALTRSLLDVTKTSFVWIIGIVITEFAYTDEYKLQSLDVVVNIFKVIGFTCIIFGTLIYNQLILTKYFGQTPKQPPSQAIISQDSYQIDETIETKSENQKRLIENSNDIQSEQDHMNVH